MHVENIVKEVGDNKCPINYKGGSKGWRQVQNYYQQKM